MLWRTVSGITGFISHADGPPLSDYQLPQTLDKSIYAGTATMYFALLNPIKVPSSSLLGQLGQGNVLTAVALSPLAPPGVYLGVCLHEKLDPAWFFGVIYVLVFASRLLLMWDGAIYLLHKP